MSYETDFMQGIKCNSSVRLLKDPQRITEREKSSFPFLHLFPRRAYLQTTVLFRLFFLGGGGGGGLGIVHRRYAS